VADLDPRFQKILADKVAEGYADAALVDRAERYGDELDSPTGVVVAIVAFVVLLLFALAWWITTPIVDAPADQPTESPTATTVQIPTAMLVVHGRSARVVGLR
jgi:hypothetical protein